MPDEHDRGDEPNADVDQLVGAEVETCVLIARCGGIHRWCSSLVVAVVVFVVVGSWGDCPQGTRTSARAAKPPRLLEPPDPIRAADASAAGREATRRLGRRPGPPIR